jgi:predicted nicotinamide N-methyase
MTNSIKAIQQQEQQNQQECRSLAQKLALGGAPTETVLDLWSMLSASASLPSPPQCPPSTPPFISIDDQDEFTNMILHECELCGSCTRYLKRLLRSYVRRLEDCQYLLGTRRGNEHTGPTLVVESDAMSEWILRTSLQKESLPNEHESCIIAFVIPGPGPSINDDQNGGRQQQAQLHQQFQLEIQRQSLLRIRVYPYHNDVALRLWEAGGCLAEYFVKHPSHVSSKHVIELGAGVGLTGLMIAATCHPESVYLTDYTDACRLNLQCNLELNHNMLQRYGFDPNNISQGYLEWNDFLLKFEAHSEQQTQEPELKNDDDIEIHCQHDICSGMVVSEDEIAASYSAFQRADVMIAADVIYDTTVLDGLVRVVRKFLMMGSQTLPSDSINNTEKVAFFAITQRNIESFNLFIQKVEVYGISCTWLADGDDCDSLPSIVESTFSQPRKDVRIAQLALSDVTGTPI